VFLKPSIPSGRRAPALATVLLVLAGSAACTEPIPQEWSAPRGADQVMSGFTAYLTHEGRRTLTIGSDSAFLVNDSALIHLKGIDGSFLNERSVVVARIVADSGLFREEPGVLVLWGDVSLFDPTSTFRVETQELVYDAGTNRLRSDSSVMVWEGDVERVGPCFESGPPLDDWTLCSG